MDGTMVNSIIILGISVFILFLLSNYLKKINKKKLSNLADYEGKIISRIPLTRNSNLFIVQVGNRNFLIASNDKSTNLIAELTNSSNSGLESFRDFPNQSYLGQPKKAKTIEEEQAAKVDEDLSFKSFLKSAFAKSN